MKFTEKEFKDSITNPEKRLYVELAISDLLGIDFDLIHNQMVIDDPKIINDEEIPLKERPHATIITFGDYIIVLFKNNSYEEKSSRVVDDIMHKISSKYPEKKLAGINFNDFEDN
ncbi:MAG TPA: hypothetical protein IAB40_03065 [Candidatus Onthocola stercoravium]|nr:hypothetical protein [Candidatus Onthocola stercoravium]